MSDIPIISITQDENVNDDEQEEVNGDGDGRFNINEAITDIEDFDSDDELRTRCKSPNKMLKIRRKSSGRRRSDGATDVEDYNDSDSDSADDDKSDRYGSKFSISEFLDQGYVDEAMNASMGSVGVKTGIRNISKGIIALAIGGDDDFGGITDCENVETTDDEATAYQIPTTDRYDDFLVSTEEGNTISIQDSVANTNAERPRRASQIMAPVSSDSDHETSSPIIRKISLQASRLSNFDTSDVENIYFTDDEEEHVRNVEEIYMQSSDTDDCVDVVKKKVRFPVIDISFRGHPDMVLRNRKTRSQASTSLAVQSNNDEGHTDIENLNSSDDDEGASNKCFIPTAFIRSDQLPLTDVEDFDGDDDLLDTQFRDIKMPSPIREMHFTKENNVGKNNSKVMPMADAMLLGIQETYIDKGLTDTEDLSGKEEDYCDPKKYMIDKIPDIDGGFTHNSESVRQTRNRRFEQFADGEPITDTEDLNVSAGPHVRRRKTKTKAAQKSKKFLDAKGFSDNAPTTDLEELSGDDGAQKTSQLDIPMGYEDNCVTDTECMSGDEGYEAMDDITDIDPSILNQESFFSTVTTKDGTNTRNQTTFQNRDVPKVKKLTALPDHCSGHTDTEDMQAVSDAEDLLNVETYSRAGTITPIEIQNVLNESGSSIIYDKNTSYFDMAREQCHIKGHKDVQDAATDVEFLEDDAQKDACESENERPTEDNDADLQLLQPNQDDEEEESTKAGEDERKENGDSVVLRNEATQLVDSVLDQSISYVSLQQHQYPDSTIRSESEPFAITCDINGVDLIKSPTIESMSGKSFDDNCSSVPDVDIVVGDDGVDFDISSSNKRTQKADRIDRKFERLSSQLDIDFDKSSEQCQADFDKAMSQINSDEVSNLQSDFSKLSWDDSVSATTADFGLSTPDNDIQELPKEPGYHSAHFDSMIPKPSPRLTKPLTAAASDAISANINEESSSNMFQQSYSRQITETVADVVQDDEDDDDDEYYTHLSADNAQIDPTENVTNVTDEAQNGTSFAPPIPKPRSQITSQLIKSQESFELSSAKDLSQDSSKISSEQQVEYSESSSLQSGGVFKHERDDDSMAVEEKLEDESYPISDKIDSDFYDLKSKENIPASGYRYSKDDSFDIESIKDKEELIDMSFTNKDDFSIYKTKEREDILDLDEQDMNTSGILSATTPQDIYKIENLEKDFAVEETTAKKTSFYIGESSGDVIVKSTDCKLNNYLDEEIEEPAKSPKEHFEKNVSFDSDLNQFLPEVFCKSTSSVEKSEPFATFDISSHVPTAQQANVLHSPVEPQQSLFDHSLTTTTEELPEVLCKSTSSVEKPEPFDATFDISSQVPTAQQVNVLHSPVEPQQSLLEHSLKTTTEELPEVLCKSTSSVEKPEFDSTFDLSHADIPIAQRANVLHSPVEPQQSLSEFEHSLTVRDDVTTTTTAQITEVRSTIQADLEQINETFATVRTLKLDEAAETQFAIEQTFEKVQQSLDAVKENLTEVMQDGQWIEASPTAEDKSLPNIKVLETSEEMQSMIFDDYSKIPKPDADGSSNEDSVSKLDVVQHRKITTKTKQTNRWSVSDPDNYSSSGSHYESFEKTDSRPCSSDVENLFTYGNSSEYQTAQPGSITEYQTAASTLDHSGKTISSRESMKSFDSESSGHLGSVEVSEASETLVPSTMDLDLPSDSNYDMEMDENESKLASLEACSGILLEEYEEQSDHVISPSMKRSQEMTFQPYQATDGVDVNVEQKIPEKKNSVEDDIKYGSLTSMDESRFAHSLEDGSVLSVSLSSASNVETIVEQFKDEMASSFGSSLIGSYEMQSLLRDDVTATSFDEPSLSDRIDNMVMTTSIVQERDEDESVNRQVTTTLVSSITSETCEQPQTSKRAKGHKRTDSTSFLKSLENTKPPVDLLLDEEMIIHDDGEVPQPASLHADDDDEKRGSGSDSDYDRYETEYSRSFKQPTKQSKKRCIDKVEKVELEKIERKISVPSIETIVEDELAEVEEFGTMERAVSQNMLDYSNIPDIMITDDPTKYVEDDDVVGEEMDIPEQTESHSKPATTSTRETSSPVQYAKESEIKMTEEEYQELIDKQYKVKMADMTTKFDDYHEEDKGADSPTSDSFEMLEQPDIADEFVIIEEVAKEADEFDTEGKSVSIKSMKYVKKHDEEVETLLVKSAPAATNEGSILYQGHDLGFEFEESPPTGVESTASTSYDPNGLDSSRKWVQMQLAEQAQNLRYPYEMERGVLEDIKEEDTDMEFGSSRISSFKDSFSSTPEYDVLAGRKYFAKEHDDMSVNSLQEFESLEQAISLENRKFLQGSQDSLSNGSFPKRYAASKNGGQGDDVSLASLKEFEGLENACIEAHLIEIKAKEEAALLLSRSDESNKSDKIKKSSPPQISTTVTTTTIVTQSTPITKVIEERVTTGFQSQKQTDFTIKSRQDESEDQMDNSSDSLEIKAKPSQSKDTSHYGSSDSLEQNRSNDVMTSSVDSIEVSKDGVATGKSSRSEVDSLEQLLQAARSDSQRRDSLDSIEMQLALMAAGGDRDSFDGSSRNETIVTMSGNKIITTKTTTTTSTSQGAYGDGMAKDISSDSLNINQSEPELLLTSTESLDQSSSVATNATYQNQTTDSQMSGSMTSCGSNTLIDTLDSQYASDLYQTGAGTSSSTTHYGFETIETPAGTTITTKTTVTHVTRQITGDKKEEQ